MRVVLQRVNHAQVTIEGQVVGKIGKGYLLLVGFGPQDTPATLNIWPTRLLICGSLKVNPAR